MNDSQCAKNDNKSTIKRYMSGLKNVNADSLMHAKLVKRIKIE